VFAGKDTQISMGMVIGVGIGVAIGAAVATDWIEKRRWGWLHNQKHLPLLKLG
jgi:hypothetical protein